MINNSKTSSKDKGKEELFYRIKLSKVQPVLFSEFVFAKTMMADHSPNEYENSIKLLIKSIYSTTISNSSKNKNKNKNRR